MEGSIHVSRVTKTQRNPPPGHVAIPRDLVRWLKEMYPEECYRADGGMSLEDHLQYAGKAELVRDLAFYAEQRSFEEAAMGALVDDELSVTFDNTGEH